MLAAGSGTLTDVDVFSYQRILWGQPDASGYDELIDVSAVTGFERPSQDRMRELAEMAAQMDHPSTPSRLAIVAASDLAFELALAFQAQRRLQQGTKIVEVFRTLDEAKAFLGVEGIELPQLPAARAIPDHASQE